MRDVGKHILAAALCVVVLTARAASAPPTASDVFDKLIAAYNNLDSYSATVFTEGYDTFLKERQKRMNNDYSLLAKSQGVTLQIDDKPVFKRGHYTLKFKKPYLQQLKIVKSDFTPAIAYGTLLTYRSDGDPEAWWAKLKFLPFALKKSVAENDAGGAITSNWVVTFMHMFYYKTNSDMTLAPDASVNGRKCYVIRFSFDWNKHPKWDRVEPPFADFEIPAQIKNLVWNEIQKNEEQKFSNVDYFIDKQKFVLLRSEEYIDGKFQWRTDYRDIKLGGLTIEDF